VIECNDIEVKEIKESEREWKKELWRNTKRF
jgi:hypothetical protein